MIAIAIANNVKILIADEPTTSLDNNNSDIILNLLKKTKKKVKFNNFIYNSRSKCCKKISRLCFCYEKWPNKRAK